MREISGQTDKLQAIEGHRLTANANQTTIDGKSRPLRLLLPIKGVRNSDRAVTYAIRRRAEGRSVSVCLLHVDESPARWQAWLDRAGASNKRHRRMDQVFSAAVRMMEGLDIEFAAYVRSGPIVFTILDAAEELACDEIVVPAQDNVWLRLLSRQVVTILMARQRSASLLAVGRNGIPMS